MTWGHFWHVTRMILSMWLRMCPWFGTHRIRWRELSYISMGFQISFYDKSRGLRMWLRMWLASYTVSRLVQGIKESSNAPDRAPHGSIYGCLEVDLMIVLLLPTSNASKYHHNPSKSCIVSLNTHLLLLSSQSSWGLESSLMTSATSSPLPGLYFSYGSNMWFQQMHDRYPDSKFIGVGKLANW